MDLLIKIPNIIFAYIIVRFIDFFFVEGFIKPTIANWGKRSIKKFLPHLFKITDKVVLKLISENDKDGITRFVREKILFLSPELSESEVDYLFDQWKQSYDPIAALLSQPPSQS